MLIYDAGAGNTTDIMAADYAGHMTWNLEGTQFAFVRYTEIPNQNSVTELGFVDISGTLPAECVKDLQQLQ